LDPARGGRTLDDRDLRPAGLFAVAALTGFRREPAAAARGRGLRDVAVLALDRAGCAAAREARPLRGRALRLPRDFFRDLALVAFITVGAAAERIHAAEHGAQSRARFIRGG
jgi:hypothetical protein